MKIRPLTLGITFSVSLILLIFTTPVNHTSLSLPQTGVQIARDGVPLPSPDPPAPGPPKNPAVVVADGVPLPSPDPPPPSPPSRVVPGTASWNGAFV